MSASAFRCAPAPEWTEQRQEWLDPALQEIPRSFAPSEGWAWLQGETSAQGHLIGGCLEVLDMHQQGRYAPTYLERGEAAPDDQPIGTPGWPEPALWQGAILCFETSEDVPPPSQVGCWLRNDAAQGILQGAAGLVLARPRGYTQGMVQKLYGWVKKVLWEAGREDLPVLANVDFGHTSPQLTLPLGVQARLDPLAGVFEVLEDGAPG